MIRRLLVAVSALAVGTAASRTVQPALLPAPARPPARCARCHKPVAHANLINGYGPDCAELLGLTTTTPRVDAAPQTGPDLFDSAREDAQ